MNGIGPSSDQQEEVPAEGGRALRVRRIVLVATAVACTVGALAASMSQPTKAKTAATAASPVKNAARASTPSDLAIAPVEPPSAPEHPAQEPEKKSALTRPGVIPASLPLNIGGAGIPAQVLEAYRRAADEQAARTPGCHLPWTLLAAIGSVESNHARGGLLTADGTTTSPILGPVLNGGDFAALTDTDGGTLDGDVLWDRAVGPMQFIPSTWSRWATTTRPLAPADPNNIFDATTTAAAYLCANNRDLSNPDQLNQAILSYNRSEDYLRNVLAWNAKYASGVSADLPAPSVDSGTQAGAPAVLTQPASTTGAAIQVSLPTSHGPVRVSPPRKNTDTARPQGSAAAAAAAQPTASEKEEKCSDLSSAQGEIAHAASGSSSVSHSTATCTPDDTQASPSDVGVTSGVPAAGAFVPDAPHASGATEASSVPSAGTSVANEAESSRADAGTDAANEASSADTSDVTCGSGDRRASDADFTLRGGALSADVSLTGEAKSSRADADTAAAGEASSAATCASGETQAPGAGAEADAADGSPAADAPAAGLATATREITGLVSELVRLP